MRITIRFKEKIKEYFKNMNPVMFTTTILLMVIGVIAIYSATATSESALVFFKKQLIWYAAGFIIMLIFANVNYNNLLSS